MRLVRSLLLLVLVLLGVIFGAGCEDSTAQGPAVGAVPTSVEITPPALTLAAGTSADVKVLVLFSDLSTKDVSSYATWTSSDTAVATVAGGKVSALKAGFATLTVTGEGQTRAFYVTVTAETLVSLDLTPPGSERREGADHPARGNGNVH